MVTEGQRLSIRASGAVIYDEHGEEMPGRVLKKEYNFPDYIQVDTVSHEFFDGKLTIDVFLKDDREMCVDEPSEGTAS